MDAAQQDNGTRLFLQVAAIFMGGGAVQLIVAIFRRRSELREVDARADSLTADVSDKLTRRLAEEADRQALRVVAMEARIEALKVALEAERAEFNARLSASYVRNDDLTRIIAQLRADLDACRTEIEALKSRLDRPATRLQPPRPPDQGATP